MYDLITKMQAISNIIELMGYTAEDIYGNDVMKTNIDGLFAAGDVTNGPDKQIVIAAGDGAKATLMAYEYLLHQK